MFSNYLNYVRFNLIVRSADWTDFSLRLHMQFTVLKHPVCIAWFVVALIAASLSQMAVAEAAPRTRAGSYEPPGLAVLYEEVGRQLVSGGAYVYVVPFQTIGQRNTTSASAWQDCSPDAFINTSGQEQAAAINGALKSMGIWIGYAQSAEFCLPMSARSYVLAGIGTVLVPTSDFDPYEMQASRNIPSAVLRSKILAQFKNGQRDATKLMVGSPLEPKIAPHPVLAELAPGDSAIFVDDGEDTPKLIARLTPKQWSEMATYWKNRALGKRH